MAIGSENFEVSGIRSGGATLWMIAALALVLRWVHLFIVKDSDLVQVLIIDSAFYHKWAVAISQGEPLGHCHVRRGERGNLSVQGVSLLRPPM